MKFKSKESIVGWCTFAIILSIIIIALLKALNDQFLGYHIGMIVYILGFIGFALIAFKLLSSTPVVKSILLSDNKMEISLLSNPTPVLIDFDRIERIELYDYGAPDNSFVLVHLTNRAIYQIEGTTIPIEVFKKYLLDKNLHFEFKGS